MHSSQKFKKFLHSFKKFEIIVSLNTVSLYNKLSLLIITKHIQLFTLRSSYKNFEINVALITGRHFFSNPNQTHSVVYYSVKENAM